MQKRRRVFAERRAELWKFCFYLKVNIWIIALAFQLELLYYLICNSTLIIIMPDAWLTDRWIIIKLPVHLDLIGAPCIIHLATIIIIITITIIVIIITIIIIITIHLAHSDVFTLHTVCIQ